MKGRSLRFVPEAAFYETMNERIVALDIGDVRIGVAVSDPTRTVASPVEVITRVGWGPDTRAIRAICDRYETTQIVSGLPLNMDGTEGFQAGKVRDLCAQLEKAGLTVFFQDERLSTVTAEDSAIAAFSLSDAAPPIIITSATPTTTIKINAIRFFCPI